MTPERTAGQEPPITEHLSVRPTRLPSQDHVPPIWRGNIGRADALLAAVKRESKRWSPDWKLVEMLSIIEVGALHEPHFIPMGLIDSTVQARRAEAAKRGCGLARVLFEHALRRAIEGVIGHRNPYARRAA